MSLICNMEPLSSIRKACSGPAPRQWEIAHPLGVR